MFGYALLQLMETKNKTQEQIARSSGIEVSVLSRLISGERIPTYPQILSISNGLKIDPTMLFPTAEATIVRERPCDDCKRSLKYVNHRGGFTQAMYLNSESKIGVYKTMIYESMSSVNRFDASEYHGGAICLRIYSCLKGLLTFHYPIGKIDIPIGNAYRIKGFETGFSVEAGSIIDIVLIGKGYDTFLNDIALYTSTK